jgi:hypothetical protein
MLSFPRHTVPPTPINQPFLSEAYAIAMGVFIGTHARGGTHRRPAPGHGRAAAPSSGRGTPA